MTALKWNSLDIFSTADNVRFSRSNGRRTISFTPIARRARETGTVMLFAAARAAGTRLQLRPYGDTVM